MKQYYKFLIILLFVSFIIPQIALASWWNPFSWNIWNNIFSTFNKPQVVHIDSPVVVQNNSIITENISKSTVTEQQKTKPETKTPTPTNPILKSSCTPNWQCTSWNTCANSQQARTCTDTKSCGVLTSRPNLTQGCASPSLSPPTCNPNWQCGNWGTCSNSVQTRACNDLNKCGNNNGEPVSAQACSVPSACVPNWQCGSWTTCSDSQRTRVCNDLNACGSFINKQTENQTCIPDDIATVQMVNISNPSSEMSIGNDVYLWRTIWNIGNNDILINSIRFREIGSVSLSAVQNFRLYVDNVPVASTQSAIFLNGSQYIDFTPAVKLTAGSKTIELLGDIVGGSNRSVSISLSGQDASLTDTKYNKAIELKQYISSNTISIK